MTQDERFYRAMAGLTYSAYLDVLENNPELALPTMRKAVTYLIEKSGQTLPLTQSQLIRLIEEAMIYDKDHPITQEW